MSKATRRGFLGGLGAALAAPAVIVAKTKLDKLDDAPAPVAAKPKGAGLPLHDKAAGLEFEVTPDAAEAIRSGGWGDVVLYPPGYKEAIKIQHPYALLTNRALRVGDVIAFNGAKQINYTIIDIPTCRHNNTDAVDIAEVILDRPLEMTVTASTTGVDRREWMVVKRTAEQVENENHYPQGYHGELKLTFGDVGYTWDPNNHSKIKLGPLTYGRDYTVKSWRRIPSDSKGRHRIAVTLDRPLDIAVEKRGCDGRYLDLGVLTWWLDTSGNDVWRWYRYRGGRFMSAEHHSCEQFAEKAANFRIS
jgi:hypothetical protein